MRRIAAMFGSYALPLLWILLCYHLERLESRHC